MTGFNHGLTGAVIALTVKNPAIAIPLAFVSHYATDLVPHYGFKQDKVLGKKFNRYLISDFVGSMAIMAILVLMFPSQKFLIAGCMVAAAIPDSVWWFYRRSVKNWPKGLDGLSAWHFRINNDFSHVPIIRYDILWFIGMWVIILRYYFV